MSERERCGNCRFFSPNACHRRAPSLDRDHLSGMMAPMWPFVMAESWCGEFEPRRDIMRAVDSAPRTGDEEFFDKLWSSTSGFTADDVELLVDLEAVANATFRPTRTERREHATKLRSLYSRLAASLATRLDSDQKAKYIARLFDRDLIDEEQADRSTLDWRAHSQVFKRQQLP